ncbi:MAG: hypothetical protein H0T45_15415 [Pyrinomonadaceae bacterium]|nr:hypothetical protein [Pyrinomonadaceae bacterium]
MMNIVIPLLVVVLAAPALPCFGFPAESAVPFHSASAPSAPASQVTGAMTPGKLIEKVATLSDASQSYALYLPSSYQPDRTWPILYCFDPIARGAVPVELFRAAAEQYGWIVVGSNNSRNGPLDQSLAAVNAVWEDTHQRFAIDGRRIYTAGFSGGARVAVRVNYLCRDCIAGVIACGAGFPPDIKPASPLSFAVFGMAGTDDFNFPELKLLDGTLDRVGAAHHLAVFDGGHQWAPKEVCAAAVEWMELQAIKTQRRKKDEALVERLWQKRTAEARGFEAAGRAYDTYKAVVALVSDFRGLRDVSEFESQMVQLKAAKVIKQAPRDEQEEINLQRRKANELVALVEGRRDADNRLIAVANFRHAVEALRKQAREEEDSSRRRVARRALNEVFAQYYEGALNLRHRSQDAALMATTLEIAAEIAPDNAQVQYELACAYALNADKKKALAALKRAIEKGFKDVAALTGDRAFDSLRAEDEYKALVEKLKISP